MLAFVFRCEFREHVRLLAFNFQCKFRERSVDINRLYPAVGGGAGRRAGGHFHQCTVYPRTKHQQTDIPRTELPSTEGGQRSAATCIRSPRGVMWGLT